MLKNIKSTSLMECLKWARIPSLPDKDDKSNVWIRAIALVEKMDGTESYVALVKDDALESKIAKDFGSVSIIRKIKSVHPYVYLLSEFVPEFKSKKKEERIEFIKKEYGNKDLSELSIKELDKIVISIAIQRQLRKEKMQQEFDYYGR